MMPQTWSPTYDFYFGQDEPVGNTNTHTEVWWKSEHLSIWTSVTSDALEGSKPMQHTN